MNKFTHSVQRPQTDKSTGDSKCTWFHPEYDVMIVGESSWGADDKNQVGFSIFKRGRRIRRFVWDPDEDD